MSTLAALEIVAMEPAHALAIQRQDSQRVQLGIIAEFDAEEAERIASAPGEAWAALEVPCAVDEDERVVAVFGLVETFRFRQATAWAVLSGEVGPHHVAITRFCRSRIEQAGYRRIEAIVECADAEPLVARLPDIDPGELVEAVSLPAMRSPGVRWAIACGLSPAAVLRRYGARSETHLLCERLSGGHG